MDILRQNLNIIYKFRCHYIFNIGIYYKIVEISCPATHPYACSDDGNTCCKATAGRGDFIQCPGAVEQPPKQCKDAKGKTNVVEISA